MHRNTDLRLAGCIVLALVGSKTDSTICVRVDKLSAISLVFPCILGSSFSVRVLIQAFHRSR